MVECIEHHRRLISTLIVTGSLACYAKNILVLFRRQKMTRQVVVAYTFQHT